MNCEEDLDISLYIRRWIEYTLVFDSNFYDLHTTA
jgi:hypothetical protein